MTPELAAGLIRYIVAREYVREAKRDNLKITRLLTGQTMRNMSRKRVILSNHCSGAVANGQGGQDWVCFWVMINKPATTKDIIIKEAKNVALAHIQGGMGGGLSAAGAGSAVLQINQAYGQARSAQTAAGLARAATSSENSKMVDDIYGQLDQAWRAGVWSTVKGTNNEFSFALQEGLIFGCAAFRPRPSGMKITMRMWETRQQLIHYMEEAERKGRWSEAGRQYARGLSEDEFWRYNSNTHALSGPRTC